MKFKVYVDYTTEMIPRPYYVGKGNQNRVNSKIRNKLHTAISEKYGFDRRVVFETDDELEALDKEIQLIAEHTTFVYDSGWGANFTRGGQGISGWKHSDESKRKNSESNKVATTGEKNGMFGKHHSEETRKKIGDNQRGWKHTEEAKQAISIAMTGKFVGIKRSEETCQKISQARRGKIPWNKGLKGAQESAFKGKTHTAEAKQKISKANKGKPAWNKKIETVQIESEPGTVDIL